MPAVAVTSLDLRNKKVLVRCDLNVPFDGTSITDPSRIDASLDTIRYILSKGGAAVLCSHLGRPKSRTPELSLKPIAEYLTTALGQKVVLAPDCIGDTTGRMVKDLAMGSAILLENLRFHAEEEKNDRDFAHELARGKQVYVNDAFGTCHRADASMVAVPAAMRGKPRVVGMLVAKELKILDELLSAPKRPFVAILGGAKVSDKIGFIKSLLTRVDQVLIGGAMSYTFMKAEGKSIGNSKAEGDKLDAARELLKLGQAKIVLPVDHLVVAEVAEHEGGSE